MAANPLYGYIEIANASATRFTDAAADDMVIYTDSNAQSICLGVQQTSNSSLKVTRSNVQLAGDLAITGNMSINGLRVTRTRPGAIPTNITTTVNSMSGITTTGAANYQLTLSNSQTDFRFISAPGSNMLLITSNAQVLASSNDTQTLPAYSWQGDSNTGMYHSTTGQIGFSCGGSNIVTMSNNGLFVNGNISANNMGMFRNRIINGDMRIAQRGSVSNITNGNTSQYMIDRFKIGYNITTGAMTQSNITLGTSDLAYQYGFNKAWRIQVTTAVTSYNWIQPIHPIEGVNIDDLRWGTSFGSPVSLSFMMRTNAPIGSVLTVSLANGMQSNSYVAPFTVTTSNTWQYVTIPNIPAPPAGSIWYTDSNVGIMVNFCSQGPAATLSATAPNTWEAANRITLSNAYNIWGTLNNFIDITGVQLEKGPVCTPFEYRPFSIEYTLCQRYYEKTYPHSVVPGTNTFTGALLAVFQYNSPNSVSSLNIFRALKRAPPSITVYTPTGTINSVQLAFTSTVVGGVNYTDGNSIHENGFWIYVANNNGSIPTGQLAHFHYVAVAEI